MKRNNAAVSQPSGGSGIFCAVVPGGAKANVQCPMSNAECQTPHRLNTQRSTLNAFTLIELLVVIAIIAIIAAILFPVFAQAREKARETTCISNSRQIGLQVRMYVQDFDETMPIFYAYNTQPPAGQPGHKGIEELILPYGKSRDLFRCPDDAGGPALADAFYGCPGIQTYQACYGSSYRFGKG